jgi:hypothetical protein
MVGHRHSPSTPLRETIYQVFSSKRRSEVAPGVGSDTDMAIISASSITYLDEATLEKLDELYNNHGRTTEASLVSELEKLQLADGDSEASSGDE